MSFTEFSSVFCRAMLRVWSIVDDVRKKVQWSFGGGMNAGLRFISDLDKTFRIIACLPGAETSLHYQHFLVLNEH
jgi:hypothetical protein